MKKIILIIYTFFSYFKIIKHWGVVIKKTTFLNSNCKIYSNVFINNSIINDNVFIYSNTNIDNVILHGTNKLGNNSNISNSCIGEYSYLAGNCNVNNVEIGKYCSFGLGLNVGLGIHPTDYVSTSPFFYSNSYYSNKNLTKINLFEEYKKTTIGNDVWIGCNVFINEGVVIGDGAIIGAGAVVTKNVPSYAIVVGVPAKIIKYRHSQEVINSLIQLKWWDKDYNWILKNKKIFQRKIYSITEFDIIKN